MPRITTILIGAVAGALVLTIATGAYLPAIAPAAAASGREHATTMDRNFPDALRKVLDCVVTALPMLDDRTSPANIVARSVIPLCSQEHREAVAIGCRFEDPRHCRAIESVLNEEQLYTQVVLRARAQGAEWLPKADSTGATQNLSWTEAPGHRRSLGAERN